MNQRFLSMCGVMAPVLFVGMTILGGAIRPGYSHISDTVSELFSPGAPNKLLLDTLHIIFTLLLILFGIGILKFVRGGEQSNWMRITGAFSFIFMGLVSVTTATIFPQDAWGSPPTFPGKMHQIMSAVVTLLTLLSMSLLGTWFNRAGIFPGFGTYSFITVGLAILSSGLFFVTVGSPIMGLTERVAVLVGFLWIFTLALWMTKRSR